MKKIVKEIQKVETVVQYESFDGKIWETEEDCKKWENSYECSLTKMWNEIPKKELCAYDYVPGWDCDDTLYCINVRSENDIKVINAWLKYYCPDNNCIPVTYDHIGKTILVVKCEYDRYGAMLSDVNTYFDNLKAQVMKYVNKLNEGK